MLEHHIITSLPKETDLRVEAAAEQEAEMLPLQIVIKVTIATHVIHQSQHKSKFQRPCLALQGAALQTTHHDKSDVQGKAGQSQLS